MQVDRVLADLESLGPKEAIVAAFCENLTPDQVADIKREYPNLQNDGASKQRLLNMVFQTACGTAM